MKNEDIIGAVIGRWKVLKNAPDKINPGGQHTSMCLCECECGTIRPVSASNLRHQKTLSCGCLNNEITSTIHLKDISGQRFGNLIALKRNGTSVDHQAMWDCICDCGKIINVKSGYLQSGIKTSCGCKKTQSYGEDSIKKYLNAHEYSYYFDSTLPGAQINCPDDVSRYRFDFIVIINNHFVIIEYDGSQHFSNKMHGQILNELFIRDNIKTKYCENNQIPLLRIKYTQIKEIDSILSIFFSNQSQYMHSHNPLLNNKQYYIDRTIQNNIEINREMPITAYDHLGNGFITIAQMCRKYDLPYSMFVNRLKRGWSLEDALTKPRQYKMYDNNNIRCEDHLGNKFQSITKMAEYWGIYRKTLQSRLNNGWELKDALETPAKIGNNQFNKST